MTDDPRLKVLALHAPRWCQEGDWAQNRLAELDAVDPLRQAVGTDAVEAGEAHDTRIARALETIRNLEKNAGAPVDPSSTMGVVRDILLESTAP